jgi:hypothetical protein
MEQGRFGQIAADRKMDASVSAIAEVVRIKRLKGLNQIGLAVEVKRAIVGVPDPVDPDRAAAATRRREIAGLLPLQRLFEGPYAIDVGSGLEDEAPERQQPGPDRLRMLIEGRRDGRAREGGARLLLHCIPIPSRSHWQDLRSEWRLAPYQLSTFGAAMNASCGMSTLPNCRF